MIQIDQLDKNIRKNPESVNIGFAAKHRLEQIKFKFFKGFGVQETSWRIFSAATPSFYRKVTTQNAVVRTAICLNPIYMRNLAKKSSSKSHMIILLQNVMSRGRTSAPSAELVKKQYQKFFIVIDQKF